MGQRNPNHQLIDAKHPMILFGFCSHPFGGAGFRWPIHSMALDMNRFSLFGYDPQCGPPSSKLVYKPQ